MDKDELRAIMTGMVTIVTVIAGTVLILNGHDHMVGVIMLAIVGGYLGLDLAPWSPFNGKKRGR